MASLRTPESDKKYKDLIAAGHLNDGCVLCKAPALKEFTYWKIIPNAFPYDRVAEIHHMIIPVRHISENDLTPPEQQELLEIKNTYINETYTYMMETTHKAKSIPPHFHLHLITLKEEMVS